MLDLQDKNKGGAMIGTKLNYCEMGSGDGPVVVFLHGFAGDNSGWANLQIGLKQTARSIAFDLPGHGKSLDYPKDCNAVVAAKAVMEDLAALGIEKVHLVGHSMGGAVACLIAMRAPDMVASMTLVAPGGFGPEINSTLLRAYSQAEDAKTIHMLLEQFFGWEFDVPVALSEQVADYRKTEGALKALAVTAGAILDGKGQKCLPTEQLADMPFPIKLIWGDQDRILPYRQASGLPFNVAVHMFVQVGHMPHLEAGRSVLKLLKENIAAGR